MKKLSLLATAMLAVTANAGQYKVDASHSGVGFKVKHLVISTVRGTFNKFDGTIDFDPAKPSALKVDATIDTKSVDTKEPKRDDHLRGDDFFATAKHPTATFKSKSGELKNGKGKLTGDLTLRGVTKPVTMDVEFLGTAKDPYGNTKVSFSGTTKINRKDFGVSWNQNLDAGGVVVSDEVEITLDIEANLVEKKVEKKA